MRAAILTHSAVLIGRGTVPDNHPVPGSSYTTRLGLFPFFATKPRPVCPPGFEDRETGTPKLAGLVQ